ncbi:integration host factor subunit alpha [Cupriavidus respiraculi]|uniref:Integration host factor subunit alpha n=1 Tax=Cupriavidus respiraculi TaxID=195930 RepID=A0ABN7YGG2_9BURK|nr:integration host factor subunit alpha [Cupriavidus respiraculi]CAG9172549.1 Integration host factor subunit alpha [Cupriavidus respiraculi]
MNDRHATLMTAAASDEPGDRRAASPVDESPDPRANEVPTLTKAELAEMLFDQVGLNKRESKDMVEAFFDVIREALEQGDSVKLSGFGNFQLRDKPQRPGRNPKTGEIIPITARRVVTFHASQKLKSLVEERAGLAGDAVADARSVMPGVALAG